MLARRLACVGLRTAISRTIIRPSLCQSVARFSILQSQPQDDQGLDFAKPQSFTRNPSMNQQNNSSDEPVKMSLDPADHQINPELLRSLKQNFKIEKFFPIQAECFEHVVHGRDVIGQSKTGTGKTLAFVLPLVEKIQRLNQRPRSGEIGVLIMEPTRELSVQVADEIRKLSPKTSVVTVYGGASIGPQSTALLRGVDVCVATPGRLQDLLDRGVCTLRNTHSVVLDEADEMLRRGFREQIERILGEKASHGHRQMLLFSATVPSWVAEISSAYQTKPVTINTIDEANSTPSKLVHEAVVCPSFIRDKVEMIGELVRSVKGRVILFVNSKSEADMMCSRQWAEAIGADAAALHGDVSQYQRDLIMKDFKAGMFKLLIATDVAARGLDVPNVELVIQTGLPQDTAFYVHRSGRTARAGKEGKCVLLYRAPDRAQVAALGREVGVKFGFTTPPRVKGQSVSALSGEQGLVTIESLDEKSPPQIADVIDSLSHAHGSPVTVSNYKTVPNGIVADVSQAQADKILAAIAAGQSTRVPIAALTHLPEELWGPRSRFEGFKRGGRGGQSGGQSGGRSYGNNRGGDSQSGGRSYRNNRGGDSQSGGRSYGGARGGDSQSGGRSYGGARGGDSANFGRYSNTSSSSSASSSRGGSGGGYQSQNRW